MIKEVIKNILLIIFVFFIYMYLPTLILLPYQNEVKELGSTAKSLVLLGSEIISLLVLIVIFIKPLINAFKTFKKSNISKAYKYWVFGLIAMMIFNLILSFILGSNLSDNEELNRSILKSYPLYSIPTMIIFGPIIEELVFRLNFSKLFKNKMVLLIVSSIIFAALHLTASFDSFSSILTNAKELLFIFPYLALAFAFGLAYIKTDNILSSILIHITHNTYCVIVILIGALL